MSVGKNGLETCSPAQSGEKGHCETTNVCVTNQTIVCPWALLYIEIKTLYKL